MYARLSDYISYRYVYMCTNSGDSALYRVTRGVPQGGVISPTLFNISIIGLEKCLPQSVEISLYADDICIWTSGRNRRVLRSRLQRAIDSIEAFLAARGLEISASKCAAVAFTKRDLTRYGLTVGGNAIPYVPNYRFLGVTFDRSFTWSPHVRHLKEKLTSIAHIFRMLSSNSGRCSVRSLLRLYEALSVGLMRYSIAVLVPLSKGTIKALETMQAQILRTCIGVPKTTSTVGTLTECRRLSPLALGTQELLRVRLRIVARQCGHPLASSLLTEVCDFLPQHYQPPALPLHPAWMFPTMKIVTTVPGITRKAHIPPAALRFFALEYIYHTYGAHTHLYTDGSVSSTSSAVAVWIPSSRTTLSAMLSHKTSSTATELAALRLALAHIIEQPARVWAIFTDSRAALQCLASLPKDQLVLDVHSLHLQALQAHHEIALQWLPAHCGITGNVKADVAASIAHNQGGPQIPVPFSRKDASAFATSVAWSIQRSIWADASHHYAPLHSIDPHCNFSMPPGISKHDEAVLHRMRLNVAYTRYFRFKINQSTTPLCPQCEVREDLVHLICDCARFSTERVSLAVSLGRPLSAGLELRDALGPWNSSKRAARATKALLAYLRDTSLDQTL